MKKINASFYSKDYQNKYSVSALIRRATNQNNVSSNDPTCLPLYDNEMAHDSIVVSVFDGRQSNAIASCIVHVSDMFASDMARLNGKVYVDARQIGTEYGSSKLNSLRNSFTVYDPSMVRVMTIESIEVNEKYRRQGVATSIIDYLKTIVVPTYIVAPIVPLFAPKVSTYTASPAQTDIQETANLLISMKFNRTEDAKMVSAGTEIKVPVYINNVKNN